jgi:uncharacterized protein (PEP-CTERM system associated)
LPAPMRPLTLRSVLPHAVLPAAVAAALHLATPANAQLLPETGTTVNLGGLRQQLEGLFATGDASATPKWVFTPSITAQESWTNHTQTASQNTGSTFITMIRPGILLSGDSGRVQATLNYAPEIQVGTGGFQERIDQNLNASGKITLIPERLFLDLRGFATVQATGGGFGPNSTVSLSRQDQTQSSSFSATPYLRQHFGDLATAELGTSLSYTSQQSLGNYQTGLPAALNGSTTNQNATTEQEYLSVTSGPDFGPFKAIALLSALQSQGSGIMDGASRQTASLDNGYAVTRNLTVLGKFGYDTVRYGGLPPFRFSGPLWNGGLRWVPNPDSSIELRYGYHDGVYSPQIQASYAPTARIRIFAHYSEALTTDAEALQSALDSSLLDPLGNPVDAQTGAPLLLAGNFFGVQNNLAWVKSGSLTAALLLDRDSVSLSVSRQNRQQVAAASLAAALAGNTSSIGTFGSVSWQHDLSPVLTSVAFVQYGVNDSISILTGQQTTDTLVISLGLNYAFTETLNGSLQCSYTNQSGTGTGTAASPATGLIYFSLRKTF